MTEPELLIEYAKAWNHLDVSHLQNILADDFEYNSQWVFETMYGKENYLKYLDGKFKTILFSPDAHPTVGLAYFENYYNEVNKPCLILKQKNEKFALVIETENGKIKQAEMVMVPNPNLAIQLDDSPN